MRLAGDHQLHRPLPIQENRQQAVAIVQEQIRSLVGCEAPRKSERKRIQVENPRDLFNLFGCCTMSRELACYPLSYEFHE